MSFINRQYKSIKKSHWMTGKKGGKRRRKIRSLEMIRQTVNLRHKLSRRRRIKILQKWHFWQSRTRVSCFYGRAARHRKFICLYIKQVQMQSSRVSIWSTLRALCFRTSWLMWKTHMLWACFTEIRFWLNFSMQKRPWTRLDVSLMSFIGKNCLLSITNI